MAVEVNVVEVGSVGAEDREVLRVRWRSSIILSDDVVVVDKIGTG